MFSRFLNSLAREDGSSLVEFALVATMMFSVVFGIMQMCMALFTFYAVAESAREGARYAMVHGATCTANGASCTATTAQIKTYVQELGYPGIVPAKMTVNTAYAVFPAGGTCSPNANCTNPGDRVTVQIVYSFPYNIPYIAPKTFSMVSTSSRIITQ